jgi:Undecaprenyl-phosphate galactose phosphotransferase WbaP
LAGSSIPFPDYFESYAPQRSRIHELPAHAHNFLLDILYGRGLLGAVGLLFLLTAIAWPAFHRRDYALLLVLCTVLLANVFDTTLFYGGVLYPLAAIAGWRATSLQNAEVLEQQSLKLFISRLTLAFASYFAGLLALLTTLWTPWILSAMGWTSAVAMKPAPDSVAFYALLLWPALAWREGLYPGHGLSAPQELKKQVSAALLASLLLGLGASFFPASLHLSFRQVLLITALSLLLLPILHALAKRLLLFTGFWGKDVVILGAGEVGHQIITALKRNPLSGLKPVALFDDDPGKDKLQLEGVSVQGTLTEAMSYAKEHGITHAIVAIPSLSPSVLARLVDRTGRGFKRLQFIPDLMGLPAEDVHASNLDGMLAIEVHNGLYSHANRMFKRLIDLVGATLLTVVLSPVLAGIYILIRLDSRGPGFYWSERVGVDGVPFRCLKFRTMHVDADERLQEMMKNDPAIREEYELYHKLDNDPRVTRVGSVLRRFSLDEFAQLWNVLKGEMSLVGARPYMVREIPVMGDYGDVILQAKPGITGLWQVSGRNELSFQERLELESHYVRNWTIWWDIIILAQTVDAVISSRGAK